MTQKREEYKGHRIELRLPETDDLTLHEVEREEVGRKSRHETQSELLIDDTPMEYGQLPDGKYFLQKYAYDWHDDLIDPAKGFIDYQIKTDEIRNEADKRRESNDEMKEGK